MRDQDAHFLILITHKSGSKMQTVTPDIITAKSALNVSQSNELLLLTQTFSKSNVPGHYFNIVGNCTIHKSLIL